jgi:pimeloyl-ACP methyl ester carboxylesterase
MKCLKLWLIALTALSTNALLAQNKPDPPDTSSHSVQFITVDKDVKLEVLDWGGTGRPLVFLAGLGDTAHTFDKFAPQFTQNYHVYGITRRGFGASSQPDPSMGGSYSAERLGDDVLAVIDTIKLNHPVLVGHSIAGEELSSIGSRHPEKVSGLIYLEAAYPYAFYNQGHSEWIFDLLDVRREINALQSGAVLEPKFLQDMSTSVAHLQDELNEITKQVAMETTPLPPPPPIGLAIMFGAQKYTQIHVPVLAFYACPHNFGDVVKADPTIKAAMEADDLARCTTQVNAFQAGVPSAHVVLLPNADHYVFQSNEAEVVREMNAFLAKLP